MKQCRKCQRVYATLAEWQALPCIGTMDPGEGDPVLEMRNCSCHSTLAIEVGSENELFGSSPGDPF